MARLERYNDEEIATLQRLVKENAAAITPLTVAELASVAEGHLAGRTADAIKQRIFKMQREGSKPTRKAATKKPAPSKASAAPARKRTVQKVAKPQPPVRRPNGHAPTAVANSHSPKLPEGLILTLPGGAQVTGRPSQIAELVKQL